MGHEDILERTLPTLLPRLRAAFAGACAERGRMVYESMEPDESDFFFDGLDFVWDYAMGKDISHPSLTQMISQVQALYDQKMEDEDSGPDTDALRSMLGAMRSVTASDIEPAKDASHFAIDMAGNTTTSTEESKRAQAEEVAWQIEVLQILQTYPLDNVDLGIFEPVGWCDGEGWPEPDWLLRFDEGTS